MSLVERRYAEALVDVALGEQLDVFQEELAMLANLMRHEESFRIFLINPTIHSSQKKELIQKALGNEIMQELQNFLYILIDRERVGNLPGIYEEFVKLADARRNSLHIRIYSPFPLSEGQQEAIAEKYKKLHGAWNATVEMNMDPSLIGGIKVIIGDKVYDSSIKTKLDSLKKSIQHM